MSANRWPGLPEATAFQIEAALARGQKIEAIKLYREATNCGLKEAKDAVESGGNPNHTTPKDWRTETINQSTRQPSSAWLTGVLALIVIGAILAVILIVLR